MFFNLLNSDSAYAKWCSLLTGIIFTWLADNHNGNAPLVSSIKNIAESEENIELSNQIINDIIGNETHVEYTQKDISDAADVVESIIETYQNSTDQDNFDLDNLSEEDLEKLESSALAKTILEKLFK